MGVNGAVVTGERRKSVDGVLVDVFPAADADIGIKKGCEVG